MSAHASNGCTTHVQCTTTCYHVHMYVYMCVYHMNDECGTPVTVEFIIFIFFQIIFSNLEFSGWSIKNPWCTYHFYIHVELCFRARRFFSCC